MECITICGVDSLGLLASLACSMRSPLTGQLDGSGPLEGPAWRLWLSKERGVQREARWWSGMNRISNDLYRVAQERI